MAYYPTIFAVYLAKSNKIFRMKIKDVITCLEQIAPPRLQEDYDNAGLLTGNADWQCSGILVTLDATENIIQEAIRRQCNMVVAHHPIVFSGLKKITGKNYVERTIISAIKNDIAIYAIHTNLDNVIAGVNGKIADMLGLVNRQVLLPKKGMLKKLVVFVPVKYADQVRDAMFAAGGGFIGKYSECSFNTIGEGTFKPEQGADPYIGEVGKRHSDQEVKIEIIFSSGEETRIMEALVAAHPYEEVAYDITSLDNDVLSIGSGIIGEMPEALSEKDMLVKLKESFGLSVIRHTALIKKPVKKVALCGGAGSFLIKTALGAGADLYVTSDLKYHEFFDAENRMLIADIGHYETEQFTINLLFDILKQKYPTFAVLKTEINTNPVHYFL